MADWIADGAAAGNLLGLLIESTLVLSLALACILLLRGAWLRAFGARSALLLWLIVPLALLALILPAPVQQVDVAANEVTPMPRLPAKPVLPAVRDRLMDAVPVATIASDAGRGGAMQPDVLAVAVWLCGVWVAAGIFGWSQRRLVRSLGPMSKRSDGSYRSAVDQTGPALIGALRSRIVLPADFERRYSPRQQVLILAHERCHLRRGDAQFTLLACALRCLFWFNPLVHLAWPRFRMDQELACDAAVLRQYPDRRRDYAEAMLATRLDAPRLPVGCTWLTGHPLKHRIQAICSPPVGSTRMLIGTVLVLLAGAAAAIGTWSHQEPQRFYRSSGLPALPFDVAPAEPPVRAPGVDRPDRPVASSLPMPELVLMPPAAEREVGTDSIAPATDFPREAMPEPSSDTAKPQPAPAATALGPRGGGPAGDESGTDHAPGPGASNEKSPNDSLVEVVHAELLEARPPAFPQSIYRPRLVRYPGMPEAQVPPDDWAPVGRLWVLLMRVRLDADGQPIGAAIEDTNISDARLADRYRQLAAEAVLDWRFSPARIGGSAVASEVLLPFYFDTHRMNVRPVDYSGVAPRRSAFSPRQASRYIDR